MGDRYPSYDVLRKWHSPSWNAKTREVIADRLAVPANQPTFLDSTQWATLRAICDRIVPQPAGRVRPVPAAALVDRKIRKNNSGGYRDARLPPLRTAWTQALTAIDAESRIAHGRAFHELTFPEQDDLLHKVQAGEVTAPDWEKLPPALFFSHRLLHDIATAYYAHPTAWSEIGYGGPASPRGYVRMDFDKRDPWEPAEARPGHETEARRTNERIR